MSCLYILEINPLLVASFANIFSHSKGCLFVLFMVSFAVQKLLSLIRSHLFICYYFHYSGRWIKKDLAAFFQWRGRRWAWQVRRALGLEPRSPTAPVPASRQALRLRPGSQWPEVHPGPQDRWAQRSLVLGWGVRRGSGTSAEHRGSGAGGTAACYALCTFLALKPREHS